MLEVCLTRFGILCVCRILSEGIVSIFFVILCQFSYKGGKPDVIDNCTGGALFLTTEVGLPKREKAGLCYLFS